MMLESIEKLRGLRDEAASKVVDNPRWVCKRAEEIADEIEREIAEKYMELPVVDGRPVHIGDELEWTDGYEPYELFTVGMIGRTYCDESYQDFAETHEHGISFGCCRWPKSDPLKELLKEFSDEYVWGADEDACSSVIAKYAAKIREAVSAE